MSKNCYLIDDVLYFQNGKINCRPNDNMDLKRGLFNGVGIPLSSSDRKLRRIYIPWNTLNSHKLTIGTTRQGKSRKMISDIDQQIARGDNVFVGEPKGSKDQEIIGYVLQSLLKHKREKDYIYISAYHHKYSWKFNVLFRKKNLEISSLIGEMIEAKDAVYKDVGRSKVLAIVLGLDFIEQFDSSLNPYDKILMERMEIAKLETKNINSLNKFIWQEDYRDSEHGVQWDITKDLLEIAIGVEKKLIQEAYERTLERYDETKSILDGVIPLRTFVTFKDIAKFENAEPLNKLYDEVKNRLLKIKANPGQYSESLINLGNEAFNELSKRIADDPTFIKKLGTTFSMALTDVTTEDIGILLNTCRINPVLDALTSDKRGAVIVYQPFPMVYSSASTILGRMMFSMFSSMAGYVGVSGTMLKRRLFINVDEAGAILSPIVKELSNKGGGLGFSLCLYTQSIADIIASLEETGARIILDNMNTKEFFKVNDNTTASEIALIMGTIKKASTTTTASSDRNTRSAAKIDTEDIADTSIIQRLPERSFLLKEGSEVYIVAAPHVDDTIFKIRMPVPSYAKLAKEMEEKREYLKEIMR